MVSVTQGNSNCQYNYIDTENLNRKTYSLLLPDMFWYRLEGMSA